MFFVDESLKRDNKKEKDKRENCNIMRKFYSLRSCCVFEVTISEN